MFQRCSILLNELSYSFMFGQLIEIAIFKNGYKNFANTWINLLLGEEVRSMSTCLDFSIQNSINLYYSCKVFTHYKSVSAVRVAPTLIERAVGKRSFTSVERLFFRYTTVKFRVIFRIHHIKSPNENSPLDTFISQNNNWFNYVSICGAHSHSYAATLIQTFRHLLLGIVHP